MITDEKWWGDFRMMNEGGVITSEGRIWRDSTG